MKTLRLNLHSLCTTFLMVALILGASPVAHAVGYFYQQHNMATDLTDTANHIDNSTNDFALYNSIGAPISLMIYIPSTTSSSAAVGSNFTYRYYYSATHVYLTVSWIDNHIYYKDLNGEHSC